MKSSPRKNCKVEREAAEPAYLLEASMKSSPRKNCKVDVVGLAQHQPASMKSSPRKNCKSDPNGDGQSAFTQPQ